MQIDTATGERTLIMSPNQADIQAASGGQNFDIIHPRISEDGEFFFFIDKADLSLWMLKL